jgi:hypothetical protein
MFGVEYRLACTSTQSLAAAIQILADKTSTIRVPMAFKVFLDRCLGLHHPTIVLDNSQLACVCLWGDGSGRGQGAEGRAACLDNSGNKPAEVTGIAGQKGDQK